jgi:predicted RNA-binding Zn-ribbon protein involved in translation (DUF1610 family)
MDMKIPKDDAVKFVVKAVLHKRIARSQQELVHLVNAELRKVDPDYSISGKRLRDIVVTIPGVRISAKTKKGSMPQKCPVCGSGLRKVWTKNLRGRKVLENLMCPKCGYSGHGRRWEPRKYGFCVERKG